MHAWMRSSKRGILDAIRSSGKFEDETKQKLVAALDEFSKIFEPSAAAGSKATEAA